MMQYALNFKNEIIVDNFAGAGGASLGIERGLCRPVDIAINHDRTAVAVHKLNHPCTRHLRSDVFEVDPVEVCAGRPVGLAWFSPDCRHFSKAKGGTPISRKVRGLAWVARRWAKAVHPRVIILENVEEFLGWGPLTKANGKRTPDPRRKGRTFEAFNDWFKRNGYVTDWRMLRACDFGTPTIRRRFFWIARCDGEPIAWPEATHAPADSLLVKRRKKKPYVPVSNCIDWSLPCPSIFNRKKPLADNTLKRIAKGVMRYVVEDPAPFIVPIANYNGSVSVHSAGEPLRTITAWPKGGSFAVAAPVIARQFGCSIGHRADKPSGTITAGGMGKTQLVMAGMTPMIGRQFGTGICHPATDPLATITTQGGGGKSQLISAFLAKHYTGVVGHEVKKPAGAITTRDHHSLVTATLSQADAEAGAKRVAAFLIKYYGIGCGQAMNDPAHTISTHDRFALVTVMIGGEPWLIVDIGMRMLQPHELQLAQGLGHDFKFGPFPKTLNFWTDKKGFISKTAQVRLIGNSVPPDFSEALVKANYDAREWRMSS